MYQFNGTEKAMTRTNNKTNNRYQGQNAHHVTVNGKALNQCQHIALYSNGFSWGYTGSGPYQLGLAISVNEFGEDLKQHPISYNLIKTELIAHFDRRAFTLTSVQIQEWINTRQGNGETQPFQPI